MNLRKAAELCVQTTGLLHVSNISYLRQYLRTTPEKELIKEIKGLHDPATLRAVWEAGVSGRLQQTFLDRMNEIM